MAIYDYSSQGLNTVLNSTFDANARGSIQSYLSGEGAFDSTKVLTETFDGSTIPTVGVELANITLPNGNVFATGDLEAVVLNSDSNGTLNVTNATADDLGVFTGDGNNTLNLTSGVTGQGFFADAGGGNDTIYASTAADTIFGGDGNDAVFGGGGADTIYGGEGNDKLFGDGGNDSISGGFGNDTIFGGAGNDVLHGEDGDDRFSVLVGEGNDTVFGGDGFDIVSFGTLKSTDVTDIYTDDTSGTTTVTFTTVEFGKQEITIHDVEQLKFRDGTINIGSSS